MFTVIHPGLLSTLQDLGRWGYERFGVPVSGAMDEFALRAANALVLNEPNACGVEMLESLSVTTSVEALAAVCGFGELTVTVNERLKPTWSALYLRAGQTLEIRKPPGGWAYLAVRGGFEVPLVLGSRSTYLRGHFGGYAGRALQAGDILKTAEVLPSISLPALAGRKLQPPTLARTLQVILGPQLGHFSHAALESFFSAEFTVTNESDRMGYRLVGPALTPQPADIISEGMPLGAIQVPANGQPLAMLADRPTTGGYPKIANLIRADVPLLAQCPPGAKVRFEVTTVEAAQAKYRERLELLKKIEEPE